MLQRPGEIVPRGHLYNAWEGNPDGGGFAYIVMGNDGDLSIASFKSLDFRQWRDAYEEAAKQHPYSPFLIHTRLATHGTTDTLNVHPFHMDRETVVGHNGVINCLMVKGDDRSDTRTFVEDYLRKLPDDWLDDPQMFDLVEDYIGMANKLAVLTINPSLDRNYYLVNEKAGHWNGDIWYSNYGYKHASVFGYSSSRSSSKATIGGGWGWPGEDSDPTVPDDDYRYWWEKNSEGIDVPYHSVKAGAGVGEEDDDLLIEIAPDEWAWRCQQCGAPCHVDCVAVCFECEYCSECERDVWTCQHVEDGPLMTAYSDWLMMRDEVDREDEVPEMEPVEDEDGRTRKIEMTNRIMAP